MHLARANPLLGRAGSRDGIVFFPLVVRYHLCCSDGPRVLVWTLIREHRLSAGHLLLRARCFVARHSRITYRNSRLARFLNRGAFFCLPRSPQAIASRLVERPALLLRLRTLLLTLDARLVNAHVAGIDALQGLLAGRLLFGRLACHHGQRERRE